MRDLGATCRCETKILDFALRPIVCYVNPPFRLHRQALPKKLPSPAVQSNLSTAPPRDFSSLSWPECCSKISSTTLFADPTHPSSNGIPGYAYDPARWINGLEPALDGGCNAHSVASGFCKGRALHEAQISEMIEERVTQTANIERKCTDLSIFATPRTFSASMLMTGLVVCNTSSTPLLRSEGGGRMICVAIV